MNELDQISKDGEFSVNGRIYKIGQLNLREGRKIFAYASSIQDLLNAGDFSFVDSKDFEPIEEIIMSRCLYDGMAIGKSGILEKHWEDYIFVMTTILGVISFRFLPVKNGESEVLGNVNTQI